MFANWDWVSFIVGVLVGLGILVIGVMVSD